MNVCAESFSPRGSLSLNEPMARHTTWRTGGPAERYFQPADIDDLAAFIASLPSDEPVTWLGLGSNLLVRDGGIRGTVVATAGALSDCRIEDQRLRAEAGVPCAKVAKLAAREQLGGLEFFAGIPGTVGGALSMNAGAFGSETWDWVEAVETIDRHGERHRREPEEFEVAYRQVRGPRNEWFVAAWFRLQSDIDAAGSERIRELLQRRSDSQPTGLPSCGSVFRNPDGDHAARLIESCGLKGYRIGAAEVSPKHANFIINTGGARAADIERLIAHVGDTVEQQTGIRLQPEVRVIGEREGERT